MAYTKKMSEENKAIYDRAAELLPAVGWAAETERYTEQGYLAQSAIDRRDQVEMMLCLQFPDVSVQRIRHQVNRVMMAERGRVAREKRGE